MIAAPVAGIVDPGPPKQVRVTHSADGREYAYIHSKSGAAAPHSKTRALDLAINYGDVLECDSASAAFDASKALDAELWYPKVK